MASIGPNELFFLLQGLKWTLALTIIGFIGGGVFGLCVALARVADSPAIQRASTGYIAVFQGTPLLMQLFVVYYGVALAGLNVDAWIAVAIAFTLHASAFLGEIWRGGIQAVPKGQTEAANALGLHYVSRMKDVVLPQAFKISLPATIGFLVQLIKGTSLAAIVGFVELSRAGQIVSNQTFRPLTVFPSSASFIS
jgi:polar amino acid transport system permease protein